jgi:hypothetical protein
MSSPTLNNGYYNGFILEAKYAAVSLLSQFIENDNKGSDCLYKELKTMIFGIDNLETSYLPTPEDDAENCFSLDQANDLVNILEAITNSDSVIPPGITGGATLPTISSRLITDAYEPFIDDLGNYIIA